jgi:Na+-transporting NADH:ubiquinone oxidoreductase subunit NqrC
MISSHDLIFLILIFSILSSVVFSVSAFVMKVTEAKRYYLDKWLTLVLGSLSILTFIASCFLFYSTK